MNETNIIQSFLEYLSSVNNAPCLANLIDVLVKADTPQRRCIAEWEIDKGVDALKDLKHSEISKSTNYAKDWQREYDKDVVSAMAVDAKKWAKDYLKARGLLVVNVYSNNGSCTLAPKFKNKPL